MSSVEERLSALESEVAVLRDRVAPCDDWFRRVSGSLKNYPEFDEVIRLGREAREQDEPNGLAEGR